MNKKGFAISSMLYTVLLLFLVLLMGILGLLGTRKVILDKMKNEVSFRLNGVNQIYLDFKYHDVLVVNTSMVDQFSFSPTDIVDVVDNKGNKITGASIHYDSKPSFDSTKNGLYTITYTGTYHGKEVSESTTIEIINPIRYDYVYKGGEESFIVPANGEYKVELWGAQGGSYDTSHPGGKGAYTAGNIALERNQNLYIQVGGEGKGGNVYQAEGGYNGGGRAGYDPGGKASGGGGATDIRLVSGSWDNFNSLKSRIMVAAGGGGYVLATSHTNTAGSAGALTAESVTGTFNTIDPTGATQTSPGQGKDANKHGSFGIGGNGVLNAGGWGGGGGSGYYGGALGFGRGGTGGSSFISGHTGCNAIQEVSTATAIKHSNQPNHYSGLVFTNTVMKSGKESMPDPYKTTNITGKNGDGHARITGLIIDRAKVARNFVVNGGFEEDAWSWSKSMTSTSNSLQSVNSISSSPYIHSGQHALRLVDTDTSVNPSWQYNQLHGSFQSGDHLYLQYYIKVNSKPTDSYAGVSITYYVSGAGGRDVQVLEGARGVDVSSSTMFLQHSRIFQVTDQFDLFAQPGIGGTGDVYVDDIVILNLTEIYGAGNEPNKAWCDDNIKYFEGAGFVPKYK